MRCPQLHRFDRGTILDPPHLGPERVHWDLPRRGSGNPDPGPQWRRVAAAQIDQAFIGDLQALGILRAQIEYPAALVSL